MKKLAITLLLLCSTFASFAQDDVSQWEFSPHNKFTMNYQMFSKSYSRGVGVGSLGYAAGYYLSGNKTEWAVVGSLLAVNVGLFFNKDYDEPEKVIGYNLGAATISVGFTMAIEFSRQKNKYNYMLHPFLQKR